MLLTTTDEVEERETTKTLGMVQGSIIRSRHVGVDILAGLKTIIGGEVRGYSKMIAATRQEALERMTEEAEKLGADAVVGIRFTTSTVMQGASEILAYGTAVKLA